MDRSLLLPAAALALWTLTVLLLVPIARLRAGLRGQLTFDDFRHGESSRVPPEVQLPNRVYMNLLEAPVLFYGVCVASVAAAVTDPWLVRLAWVYVGLRLAHSLIYLTYNRVPHRLTVFALSNVVLSVLWGLLAWHVSA